MSDNLVSPDTFKWLLTGLTVAACVWALYDVVLLAKLRGADARDPLVRDKRFGYATGILIGLFGIAGVLRYHGVL